MVSVEYDVVMQSMLRYLQNMSLLWNQCYNIYGIVNDSGMGVMIYEK